MGDRGVVGFAESVDSPTIYLYSHWGGSSLIADTQEAIRNAAPRWNDPSYAPSYATRIAVSRLVGSDWERETGYGLSVDSFPMPDYPYVLRVVWHERNVYVLTDLTHEVVDCFSFQDFLSLVDEDLERGVPSI
jgi:hypothetical protein